MPSRRRRHSIRDRGASLVVSCEPPREAGVFVFLGAWMAAWAIGTFAALASMMQPGGADAYLVAWLAIWLAAGIAALGTIVWQAYGREELEFSVSGLMHRWHAAGIGRTVHYPFDRIHRFRSVPWVAPSFRTQHTFLPPGLWKPHGVLAFDFEGRIVQAGAALRDDDARLILAEVGRRFPRLIQGEVGLRPGFGTRLP